MLLPTRLLTASLLCLAPLLLLLVVHVDAAVDCTLPLPIDLGDNLSLQQIANYEAGTFTMKLTYTGGQAWIGIGINSNGSGDMVPAHAVIGRADNGAANARKYQLTSDNKDASGVQPLASSAQTLQDATFVQTGDTSTLTFTQFLDESEQTVKDSSQWIFAVGLADNVWAGKHKIHGSFQLPLTSCISVADPIPNPTKRPTPAPTKVPTTAPVMFPPSISPKPSVSPSPTSSPSVSPAPSTAPTDDNIFVPEGPTPAGNTNGVTNGASAIVFSETVHPYRTLWMWHGITLFLAWGICAPIGIGAAILKSGIDKLGFLPKGLWYKTHFYMNILTVLLTVVGFLLAIVATEQEEGEMHFSDVHHKAGLAIFILVILQAIAAYLRPDLPKAVQVSEEKADPMSPILNGEMTARPSSDGDGSPDGSLEVSMQQLPSPMPPTMTPPKSTLRLGWEYSHRLLGVILLGLAWYNCHTGIVSQVENWEADGQQDWTGVFWGITVAISGMIFVLAYVIRV